MLRILALLAALIVCSSANAEPLRFAGADQSHYFDVTIGGDLTIPTFSPAMRHVDITVDGNTAFHHSLRYVLHEPQIVSWMQGPIAIQVTINEFSVEATNRGPIPLALNPDQSYAQIENQVEYIETSQSGDFPAAVVTGSVLFTGPAGTVPVDWTATFQNDAVTEYAYGLATLPDRLEIRRFSGGTRFIGPQVIFDGQVEGIPMMLTIDEFMFDGKPDLYRTVLPIPEPSTFILGLTAVFSIIFLRRRFAG